MEILSKHSCHCYTVTLVLALVALKNEFKSFFVELKHATWHRTDE